MRILLVILCSYLLLVSFTEEPDKMVFYGTVVNDTTNLPMQGVSVKVDYGYSPRTITDVNGNFRIEIEKKYCVDSLFSFYGDSYFKEFGQKLIPGKQNIIRYKFKPWFEPVIVIKTPNCFPHIVYNKKAVRKIKQRK